MKQVYVVTSPEPGWDCIVGVWEHTETNKEMLEIEFPYPQCIISEQFVYTVVTPDHD